MNDRNEPKKEEGYKQNKRILICGGAGFMGSNFVKYILDKYPQYGVVNYDKLTYAGNLENLRNIEENERYAFIQGDIVNEEKLNHTVKEWNIGLIVNFAAETHVDRSIEGPETFINTNVHGVRSLLETARKNNIRLIQISTDEVFGSTIDGKFAEEDPFLPNSPYSASKAAGDLLCRSYYETYQTDVIVTHCCNVFGPNQYPEKLIPLFVTNLLEGKKVPVYGNGQNVREWIYVDDHSHAVDFILRNGETGGVYNIGSGFEKTNLELTKTILEKMDKNESYIEYVEDRKGHDLRYAIDSSKLRDMGWAPKNDFETSLDKTISWYKENEQWWLPLKYKEVETTTNNGHQNPNEHTNKEMHNGNPQKNMKALITAGGRGTRLRPLTFTRNKHIIQLANKPMIELAIEKVVRAGITDIGISINENDEELPQAIGDGSRFGANITYIEQKGGALGLAHVVKNAKPFLEGSDFMLYLGDNIILSELDGFVDEFYSKNLNCLLALSQVEDPQRFGVPVIEDNRVVRVEEKPENPASNFAVTGIYLYDESALEAVEHTNLSPRGEYEISDVHTWLIEKGYNVGFKEITGWWKDTGKPEDLLDGNRLLLEQITGRHEGHIDKDVVVQGKAIIEEGAQILGKSFIRGPVVIGKNAIIEDACIGPCTSIGAGAIVKGAEVEHSIVMDNADIQANERIVDSIFGHNVVVRSSTEAFPRGHKLIAGDNSQIEI